MSTKRVSYTDGTFDDDDYETRHGERFNQAAIMAKLPSKQPSFTESSRSLEHKKSTSLKRKESSLRRRRSRKITGAAGPSVTDVESGEFVDGLLDTDTDAEAWEKRQTIKGIASSLEFKKRLRTELLAKSTSKVSGFDRWKHRRRVKWKYFKIGVRDFFSQLELWRGSFKKIEGNFGTAVLSYFRFVKWLLFLNIFIALLTLGVMMVPQVVLPPPTFNQSVENISLSINRLSSNVTFNSSDNTASMFNFVGQAATCSADYNTAVQKVINDNTVLGHVLDLLQGTGWMERTVLFHGFYFNKTVVWVNGDNMRYNMPLAFLLVAFTLLFVSLVLMVRQ